jgi:hypothetical protein
VILIAPSKVSAYGARSQAFLSLDFAAVIADQFETTDQALKRGATLATSLGTERVPSIGLSFRLTLSRSPYTVRATRSFGISSENSECFRAY